MDCAEARRLLSELLDAPEGATREDVARHLSACTTCRTWQRRLRGEQELLAELWREPRVAPEGFAARLMPRLPHRPVGQAGRVASVAELGHARPSPGFARLARGLVPSGRLTTAAAVVAVALLAASILAQPAALAGLGLFLQRVILRESPPPAALVDSGRMEALSLEEARALARWRIRTPTALPEGYRLEGVYAGETHAFAAGPTIVLRYRGAGERGDDELRVVQVQAAGEVPEPVEAGAAQHVAVGTGTGLFIDGLWVERGGGRVWERGTLARLIVEQGELVIQLEADPRHGWDARRLAEVAASLR